MIQEDILRPKHFENSMFIFLYEVNLHRFISACFIYAI